MLIRSQFQLHPSNFPALHAVLFNSTSKVGLGGDVYRFESPFLPPTPAAAAAAAAERLLTEEEGKEL